MSSLIFPLALAKATLELGYITDVLKQSKVLYVVVIVFEI